MTSLPLNLTDEQLLFAIQKGEKKAFDTLFLRYYFYLCAYARNYVSFEEAEEVAQDTMVWFWENRSEISIDHSVKGYLFTAIKNKCLNLKKRNELRDQIISSLHEQMIQTYDSLDFYDVEELTQRLEAALNSLPETYRQAFELNRFESLTYKEIAERLQVSPKTVDYRIQQALKILRKKLLTGILFAFFLMYFLEDKFY